MYNKALQKVYNDINIIHVAKTLSKLKIAVDILLTHHPEVTRTIKKRYFKDHTITSKNEETKKEGDEEIPDEALEDAHEDSEFWKFLHGDEKEFLKNLYKV